VHGRENAVKGCRPLSDEEITQVNESFERATGKYRVRDRCLFVLGHRTGYRASELLSLTVGDVWQHGRIVDHVTVHRRHMKGGGGKPQMPKPRPEGHPDGCRCRLCCPTPKQPRAESRTVRLHPEAQAALLCWVMALSQAFGALDPKQPLFRSRKSKASVRAISREHLWYVLKQTFHRLQLPGPLGTHTLRKTLARRMWDYFQHDLLKVRRALGHKAIQSTIAYLGVDDDEIDAAFVAA
jgi:integrase